MLKNFTNRRQGKTWCNSLFDFNNEKVGKEEVST